MLAGNRTDFLAPNKWIEGFLVTGNLINPQKEITLINTALYQLTDFTLYTGPDENTYAAGTGIYYPAGANGSGYPFIGIYQRGTGTLVYFAYYNLKYTPESAVAQSCVGLRIKYSTDARSLYICGTIVDRQFADLNFQDLIGKSKGFILKARLSDLGNPDVRIFTPDNIAGQPDLPLFSAITDMEFYSGESKFAFTGIHTKQNITGYYGPIVGEMAPDLSLQWCRTYEIKGTRVSGVDVEYNTSTSRLLVMMNQQETHFSIMETDFNGSITQNPVNYTFTYGVQTGNTRSHMMHHTAGNALVITGNSYFMSIITTGREQWLYKYEIPNASNLLSGNAAFNSYSEQKLPPLGRQEEVTAYWTPENSVYQDGNLSIAGCYNNNDLDYGLTFVDVSGMSATAGCIETGDVVVWQGEYIQNINITPSQLSTNPTSIIDYTITPLTPEYEQYCPPIGKSVEFFDNGGISGEQKMFKYLTSDASGIFAEFYVSKAKTVAVSVYDMNGRQVYTEKFNLAEGTSNQYLKFRTLNGVYMVKILSSEGAQSHKVLIINR